MLQEIKRLFIEEKYKEASIICKQLLQDDSNNHELWYMLFLADNNNFLDADFENLNNEIAFNKAIQLADNHINEIYQIEYNFYKNINKIRDIGNLYRYAQYGLEDKINDYLDSFNSNVNTNNININYNLLFKLSNLNLERKYIDLYILVTKKLYDLIKDTKLLYMCILITYISKTNKIDLNTNIDDLLIYDDIKYDKYNVLFGIKELCKVLEYNVDNLIYEDLEKLITKNENEEFIINDTILEEYIGSNEYIIIPKYISKINDKAFADCINIKTIIIPSSVEEIGKDVFANCINLENVIFAHNTKLKEIKDDNLFKDCKNIRYNKYNNCLYLGDKDNLYVVLVGVEDKSIDKIDININTEIIFNNSFEYCHDLIDIVLPYSIKYIGKKAFYYCVNIKEIVLPESLIELGESAFAWCSKLEYIDYSNCNKLTDIKKFTFNCCENLKTIELSESILYIDDTAFNNCNNIEYTECRKGLYLGTKKKPTMLLHKIINRDIEEFYVDINTISIANDALAKLDNLRYVYMFDNVKNIGKRAFYNCKNLESIKLSNSIVTISESVFEYCHRLKSIDIAPSILHIHKHAFKGCGSLENIVIPDTVLTIGENILLDCYSLNELTIPFIGSSINDTNNKTLKYFGVTPSIKKINITKQLVYDEHIFSDSSYSCTIIFPKETTTFKSFCFSGTKIKLTNIPQNIEHIDKYAFYFSIPFISKSFNPSNLISLGEGAFKESGVGFENVYISKSVKHIESAPFSCCETVKFIVVDKENKIYDSRNNCNAIIETNTNTLVQGCVNTKIDKSVTIIAERAFEGCRKLESIEIPFGVKKIGKRAFASCVKLCTITIPKTIEIIDVDAFEFCNNLERVIFLGSKKQWNKIKFLDKKFLFSKTKKKLKQLVEFSEYYTMYE